MKRRGEERRYVYTDPTYTCTHSPSLTLPVCADAGRTHVCMHTSAHRWTVNSMTIFFGVSNCLSFAKIITLFFALN